MITVKGPGTIATKLEFLNNLPTEDVTLRVEGIKCRLAQELDQDPEYMCYGSDRETTEFQEGVAEAINWLQNRDVPLKYKTA